MAKGRKSSGPTATHCAQMWIARRLFAEMLCFVPTVKGLLTFLNTLAQRQLRCGQTGYRHAEG